MSFSMNKLRAFLPGIGGSGHGDSKSRHSVNLEPEIGFQLTLNDAIATPRKVEQNALQNSVPELNVHLISARHLPASFGLKTVQGYVIKVKLFPGTNRYDSSIQTSTWPKFNENFKFPMGTQFKS